MNIIATKKEGIGAMYLACTVVGVLFAILGIAMLTFPIILFGVALSCVCGYIYHGYVSLPQIVITVDDNDIICLPKGVSVKVTDLVDVSYRRASAKGIQYRWGSVTLKTHDATYKYGYLAECEEVAKRLTEMMYQAKYKAD